MCSTYLYANTVHYSFRKDITKCYTSLLFTYSTTGKIFKSGLTLEKAVVKLLYGDNKSPKHKDNKYTLVAVKSPTPYLSQISAADSWIQSLCLTEKI